MVWYFNILNYLWGMFKIWISTIFVVPFQNLEMLWLLVPIWVTWFFAEFFQEKKGTSMGNAITNAVVVVWGSIDCTRQTVNLIQAGTISGFLSIFARFAVVALIFGYGVLIVILGLKGKQIIKYIGRVREVTYVFAVSVPVFYNAINFSWQYLLAVILFFPLFYFVIELIDKYTPNPVAVQQDLGSKEDSDSFGSSSDSLGSSDNFSGSDNLGGSNSMNTSNSFGGSSNDPFGKF